MGDWTPRQVLAELDAVLAACVSCEATPAGMADLARSQVGALRREIAIGQMAQLPIGRLRETAKGLRLDALERAGIRTVAELLKTSGARLRAIPGVGDATVTQALGAARQILAATENVVRLHFDVVARPEAQTEVLLVVRRYSLATQVLDESLDEITQFRDAALPLVEAAAPAARPWLRRVFMRSGTKDAAAAAVDSIERLLADPKVMELRHRLERVAADVDRPRSSDEVWEDYEHHAAHLLGVLGEIVDGGGGAANRGHLPEEIVERVQALQLDTTYLKANLRGYQAFGAKYALVQERSILGDEMGLGKTVEALAALCHLRAGGRDNALVVCPASVVANWRIEIHRHTKLTSRVVHGAERDRAYRSWLRQGGVAITTFDALRRLEIPPVDAERLSVAMLVVDEAHYVKNPRTHRSQAVARWAQGCERVLFLTGTPMENRIEEFRALIQHLQPDVASRVNAAAALAGPAAFQLAVAPAYLRRNQIDVLNELPEQIPSLDWVNPSPDDLRVYRDAVAARAFPTMRRAAYLSIGDGGPRDEAEIDTSAKSARLIDIVEEASEEGLKIVVFSYFRDVLDRVTRAASIVMPGAVFGPLTGSTPPVERQRLVDALCACRSRGHGVHRALEIWRGGIPRTRRSEGGCAARSAATVNQRATRF